ncbi:MAG: sulfite exporter TauE/SafE family protein [Gammaproteobacteria bacterium]|nr:sulfite exporter TauE/SafE family protein [Gammaproteobacteria bacterium]
MEWMYTLAGLGVGFAVGMTGVGGGALMTPLLVLGFGVSPSVAVGTDLLYAAITKSVGVWVHGRKGTVNWKIVGLLAAGSLPAALVTIGMLKLLAADTSRLQGLITDALGVALILTALALLFKDRLITSMAQGRIASSGMHRWRAPTTILAGVVLGALVTLTSVGAGALGAVVLFLLYPRLPAAHIVGTDLAYAVPLVTIAGLGHFYFLGTVDVPLLGSLLLGSLPGIWLGSHIGTAIPERVLRPILGGMLAFIGVKLI